MRLLQINVHQSLLCGLSMMKHKGTCRQDLVKKDQISYISHHKMTLYKAGNTAYLVFLLRTYRAVACYPPGFRWVPGCSIIDRLQGTSNIW